MILHTSPFESYPIESMITYSKGFIVGGANCLSYIYERHEGDLKNPYIRLEKKI